MSIDVYRRRVRSRLCVESFELRATFSMFEDFEEHRVEQCSVRLSSRQRQSTTCQRTHVEHHRQTNLFIEHAEIVTFVGQHFDVALNLNRCTLRTQCQQRTARASTYFGHVPFEFIQQ
jgi:hypothetical protein